MQTTISKFPDFIGVFENALPDELCDSTVEYFEKLYEQGFSVNRQKHDNVKKTKKEDDAVFACTHMNFMTYVPKEVLHCIWENAYKEYVSIFSILDDFQEHSISDIKIQKTLVGGGYHVWHCESSTVRDSRRIMVYTIYLNDVEEGGETEFLYYPRRIKAKKGTIVLFPAGYTHTHRGNPPISNTKYIATGWIEF
jgi:hypothetical protein